MTLGHQPGRTLALDLARGWLMAYIIVVIHGVFWLKLLPPIDGGWLLFEMPLVFLISGLTFRVSNPQGRSSMGPQALIKVSARRLSRVLIPYLFYAACAGMVAMVQTPPASITGALLLMLDWLNPVTHGAHHPFVLAQSHLWFIPPFLLITTVLPWVIQWRKWNWLYAAPELWGVALAVSLMALRTSEVPGSSSLRNFLFYGFWALLGHGWPELKKHPPHRWLLTLVGALGTMLLLDRLYPVNWDMQTHKFPPDELFALFCFAWVGAFAFASTALTAGMFKFNHSRGEPLLRPFVRHGYSLYLWQGLGYSFALEMTTSNHLPNAIAWPLAILFTLALGRLAAPVERLRIRQIT